MNFLLLFTVLCFAVLYGVRMFVNHPWYDELYTYYSFISRGPFYAAIHWPLPNNHIGYSVLSGFLNYLGNPTIALRGVSYVCALINLVLVYRISEKMLKEVPYSSKVLSFGILMLYACNILVHTMAVQGRGYTLSTTCYLCAILCLLALCDPEKTEKRRVFGILLWFSLMLALGIYAVPSSTFWVIPLCVTGGLYFLRQKRIGRLFALILSSLFAAALTLGLYLTVWLAVGANLLSKDPAGPYYGIYQLEVVKRAPLESYRAGLAYMLASPYIQSMDRQVVIRGLFHYLWSLFNQFLPNLGLAVMGILVLVFVFSFVRTLRDKNDFFALYLACSVLLLPVMFIIQSVQPYLRVSSFFGAVFALGTGYLAARLLKKRGTGSEAFQRVLSALILLSAFALLLSSRYRMPMADRENDIKEVLDLYGVEENPVSSVFYTDDYQKYVLKFYYDMEPVELPLGEAETVLVSDTLRDPAVTETVWPMFFHSSDFDFDTLSKRYEEVRKTEKYTIYRLREEN